MLRISKKDFKIFRMRGRAFCPPSTDRARESFSRAVLPAIGAGGNKVSPGGINGIADECPIHPVVRAARSGHKLRGGILVVIRVVRAYRIAIEAANTAGPH